MLLRSVPKAKGERLVFGRLKRSDLVKLDRLDRLDGDDFRRVLI